MGGRYLFRRSGTFSRCTRTRRSATRTPSTVRQAAEQALVLLRARVPGVVLGHSPLDDAPPGAGVAADVERAPERRHHGGRLVVVELEAGAAPVPVEVLDRVLQTPHRPHH